jgi:phosphoribosylamine--glycine ligase
MFALCSGTSAVPLALAQDYKRAYDGDLGPNTGGMGAYSPVPWISAELEATLMATVVQPVLDELSRRGTPFSGVLFPGLILTPAGVKVIEFNARFGDPECQVVLERLRTPLAGLLMACAIGTLSPDEPLEWRTDAAVNVVVASDGYPAQPVSGDIIDGLSSAGTVSGVHVLHAGTALNERGQIVSAGGRVLNVIATDSDLDTARTVAYTAVNEIRLRDMVVRTDIAASAG